MGKEDTVIRKSIVKNHEMLDVIRLRKNTETNIETLRTLIGISRVTADRVYQKLRGEDPEEKHTPLVYKSDRKILVKSDEALFLGISIGSSHVRVVLLGLDFEPVPRDILKTKYGLNHLEEVGIFESDEVTSDPASFSFKTPVQTDLDNAAASQNSFFELKKLIGDIVDFFLSRLDETQEFPLYGIGFAVTGPVNFEEKKWHSAPRFTGVENLTLLDLIGQQNMERIRSHSIFLSLENNAKAAAISEYQYLLERNKGSFKDIGVLYIGSGIGYAAVIDNQLLRGKHSFSGEIGHIRMPIVTQDGKSVTFDRTLEDLQRQSPGGDGEQTYIKYLPFVLHAITCMLGVEDVILIGHSINREKTSEYQRITSLLIDQRVAYTVQSTQNYSRPLSGRNLPSTAAIGAAIESYYSLCGARWLLDNSESSGHNEFINLTTNIVWPKLS